MLIYDMEKFIGGAIGVICGSALMDADISVEEAQKAVNEIFRINDALRIRIVDDNGKPQQYVADYAEADIEVLHFGSKAELDSYAAEYAKEPLDFYGALAMIKIVLIPGKIGLLAKLHHIISDAWTLSLIATQFNELIKGDEVQAFSYFDYIKEENEYVAGKRYQKDRDYFLSQFAECDESTFLSEKQAKSFSAERVTYCIDKERTAEINSYAAKNNISAFSLFMTAAAVYFSRVKMNTEKFYLGTPLLNRADFRQKNTVGMFINTVPLLINLDNESAFAENLKSVETSAFSAMRHQRYNYGDLLDELRKSHNFSEKLYDVILSFQNAKVAGGEVETTWYHSGLQGESLQIHIDDRDSEGIFRVHYDYLTEKFAEDEIEKIHRHICNLLFDGIANPNKKLHELNILTPEEQQKLLYTFNDTAVEYPKDKCVHQLFEEQVKRTPDKTAIVACDKTMTYRELNEEANKIAHSLIEKGIGVGDIVAFMLLRKSYMISTILGILKSGAAYLPIDPDYPQDRIDYMLSDSNAKILITENDIEGLLDNSKTFNPCVSMSSESLCYCIYTSGSTGRPKGTTIYHHNLVNLLLDNKRYIRSDYRIALLTTICFDVAAQEILGTLTLGLSGYLFRNKNCISTIDACEMISNNEIDVLFATPTYFDALTQIPKCAEILLKHLKLVVLAGEKFYLNDVVKRLANESITFLNQYGPAETHVSTCCQLTNETMVHVLFEEQVERTPDKTAIIACDKTLTYRELNEEANKIAHSLIEKGIGVGDIVAFMLLRKSYMISTILGILKSGAAYLPIDPDYPQDRIDYMLSDSNAKILITENDIEGLLDNSKTFNPCVSMSSESLCYCIYTSGSTGRPKGTLLTHSNVANYVNNNSNNVVHKIIKSLYNSIVSVTTVGFDIFVTESLLPLVNGMEIVLANEEQSKTQAKLNALLKLTPADVIQTTPTKLKALIANDRELDYIKNIKTIILGGEVLDVLLIEDLKKITNADIFNIYGPTETTVWATNAKIEDNITIGKPIANTQIYIVDKYMQITPIGVIGEICIAGDGVGAGYLNRPELTAEKFIDNPFGKGKLYKTGDLAYWREDGNIAYVGRNDFQVKIRGLRIELGEIENVINSVDGISQSVVVVRKDEAGRQLICAFYTGEEKPAKVIRDTIGKRLPKYMLPHIFTHIVEMPLTSSGKVNRKALPEIDLENIETTVEFVEPKNEAERNLVDSVKAVLNCEKVSTLDNFFDVGGDSLKAIELASKLESRGYEVQVKTIFECGTIQELAKKLSVAEKGRENFDYSGDIPATDAQMRVYTAQSMNSDSTTYNVPYAFEVEDVNIDRLQNAVNKLIARHESLRTHFENKDGKIIQIIDETADCRVERLKSDDIADFIRPFDLSKSPLLRIGAYGNIVMTDMHHIITDGSSMPVFFKELNELYMGRELENKAVQYKQFAVQKQDHSESEKYWLSVYGDELPELEINTDYHRGQKQSFNGSAVYDKIDIGLHNRILSFCKKNNITPYVFYMGGFNVLLSKFSGNEDIVVGMPISGRDAKYLDTIGMFVNTIALRNKPEGTKAAADFLREVKENSVNAIKYQDYPYGELVKKLNIQTQNRSPLFDVMLAYQSEQMTDVVFGDKKAELLPIPITTSKYDFTFNIMPRKNDVVIMAEYCTELYKETTVKRFIFGFKQVLEQLLADNKLIENISVISPEEQQKLLYTFNDTAVEYPKDKCVHQLFEEQVERTPDKTAIIFKDIVLSYFELNELVQKYADILVSLGINKGNVVAVHLERSHRLIVLQLAVLKIGAIFLPVDKRYPIDRIEYMCKDCNVNILVSDDSDDRHIKANVITIDEFEQAVPNKKAATVNNSGICYIIYTSGSTGTPKGCSLTGQGLTNFCRNNNTLETLKNRENNVFACVNSVSFDYFIAESLLPLTNGYTTVIFDDNESTIQDEFLKIVSENAVNIVMTTPTRLKIYFNDKNNCSALKQLTCICTSGEPLAPELLAQLYDKSPNAQVYNPIGPSECSVWDIGGKLNRDDGIDIHIGKPIANTQIYITDKYMQITPIGVTGELCIAGDGVGAGYLNRPELTAEKFIDNPFGKGKLYKTGDLAYWREDGNIVYVGRNDFQVKIRGLRIELGEIENAMNSIDGVSQSVVVVRKNAEGRQLICAFYTGEEKHAKEIRSIIGKKLPKYMLPHIFTHIAEMPLTSSGKVNRKALPEVDLNCFCRDTEHIAPETQLQKQLCAFFETVLGIDSVGITDNFFDFGGDSLKAIELVSKAHNGGIYFSLQNVFDYPTVTELCECIESGDRQIISFDNVDFSKADSVLSRNTVEQIAKPAKTQVGNILLAGATGFLGIHILADYLDNDSGTAYCLVRGNDNNDSANRLRELLRFYFGDKYATTDRVEVVCADLQRDGFDLSTEKYEELLKKVDTVINCAASVKHYGSYKYFYEVNVETVKRLIEFCKESGSKLIHTSTLSVSGNSFGDEFDGYVSKEEKHFYESSLYIGQPLDNVYARSKFEAEKAVLDAMANGLKANIMRMGNLTNRLSDGQFQKNHESNAFLRRIGGIIELGKVPDYLVKDDLYSEFTPIDEAASAVMTIARHFSAKQTVFHINSTKVVYLGKLLQMFNELGFELKIVDGPEFTKALRRTVDKYETEHIFETFINDIDENDQLCYESNIYIENDFTVQYLKILGFEWSDIDITYIQKYVQYFKRIGYFNEKRLPIL